MSQEHISRHLAWDACYNAREVGGYPTENGSQTRRQALIRTDNLHRLTAEGQSALRDYGVRTIIDLRSPHEIEREANPFAAEQEQGGIPRYLNMPIVDTEMDAAIDAADSTLAEYLIILEKGKGPVGAVVRAVAENMAEGAVLVHCHGGKDRTGIIIALLLALVGVPRDTIADDYSLSETILEASFSEWLEEQTRLKGRPVERPRWMRSRPETMLGVLDYLDQEYGGVEAYLKSAGVTQADITQIREHLIAPAEV
ncbi:MAG: tyrosine-protein phosphatase [Chloroflexota bacterium]